MYKGECCPSCGVHPSNFMSYDMVEFHCAVCKEDTKRVSAYRPPVEE